MNAKLDIVGDIHGYADELEALLGKLGYRQQGGVYRHNAGRQVAFVGDYVDRGPKIRRVLEIVRGMVDAGTAFAILGNHEVNALRYHTIGSDGKPLRKHSDKNVEQHAATLAQFADPVEWLAWMQWLAGLPFSLEINGLRVVHAAWDPQGVREMRTQGRLEGAVLERYSYKMTKEFNTISQLLNGPEALLPDGLTLPDAEGNQRPEIRVKWWMSLKGRTCREAIFPDSPDAPELPLAEAPSSCTEYPKDAPVTFFGHYALKDPTPQPIKHNLACLDYGVGKDGFLCAYRWDGEQVLETAKFVCQKDSGS